MNPDQRNPCWHHYEPTKMIYIEQPGDSPQQSREGGAHKWATEIDELEATKPPTTSLWSNENALYGIIWRQSLTTWGRSTQMDNRNRWTRTNETPDDITTSQCKCFMKQFGDSPQHPGEKHRNGQQKEMNPNQRNPLWHHHEPMKTPYIEQLGDSP